LAETRAKLSGVGGYAPPRSADIPAREKFSIVIQFSGDRSEEVAMMPSATIDGGVFTSNEEPSAR